MYSTGMTEMVLVVSRDSIHACAIQGGYVTNHTDCNDNNATVYRELLKYAMDLTIGDGEIDGEGVCKADFIIDDADGDGSGNATSNICLFPPPNT